MTPQKRTLPKEKSTRNQKACQLDKVKILALQLDNQLPQKIARQMPNLLLSHSRAA